MTTTLSITTPIPTGLLSAVPEPEQAKKRVHADPPRDLHERVEPEPDQRGRGGVSSDGDHGNSPGLITETPQVDHPAGTAGV